VFASTAAVNPLRYVALSYVKVAGSDPKGRIGQATSGATLLTKVTSKTMVRKRSHVSVFGRVYPTPDGYRRVAGASATLRSWCARGRICTERLAAS
jgi:UDP-glucose 4-epimerase